MKKAVLSLILCLALTPAAFAIGGGTGYKQINDARDIAVDITDLDGTCSGATNVQECLDLLDDAVGGGGSGDITSVVAGAGLTGGATSGAATLDIGAGLYMDVAADSISFDPTEFIGDQTWADGSNAAISWTWNLSGTDVVFAFSSGALAITGNLSASNLSGTNTGDQDLSGLQPLDSDLTYLAGFTPSANVKTILNAADFAAVRTALSLVIGTNVQAWDADLDYLAGFTPSANVKTILNAADYAAVRTALSLVIGTNVQAWDADLDTWAGITPGANVGTFLATPSSVNLAAAVTGETGSGALVFADDASMNFDGGDLELPNSNTLPATCTVGQIYMDADATTGQRLYACESTNTWALQGDGGGGGSGDITSVGSACASGACDSISIADGQKVDASAVNMSASTEGVIIGGAASVTGATGTGQLALDTDATGEGLHVGLNSEAKRVGWFLLSASWSGTSATRWIAPFGGQPNGTEANVDIWEAPFDMVCKEFHAQVNADPGASGSWTNSANINGTASATKTCNITNGTTECDDDSDSLAIAKGDNVNFEQLRVGTASAPGESSMAMWCRAD